jgi:hypothetical protein
MTTNDDPRANGYNYGAPLPIPSGFGLFNDSLALADRLRDISHEAGDRSWRIDMAVRDVRHACTPGERHKATEALRTVYEALSRFSPSPGSDDPRPDYSFESLAGIAKTPYQKDAADD